MKLCLNLLRNPPFFQPPPATATLTGTRRCLRRYEGICLFKHKLVIASEARQSSGTVALDCRVALLLAMTIFDKFITH
jgi:hypothetical protein